MGWFSKKRIINGPPNAGFDDTFMGVSHYRPVHQETEMPDPGASKYAWVTYALPAFTPIGPGVHAMSMRPQPFGPPPLMSQQGAITVGVPLTAGQFILQPLLNPLGPTVLPPPKGYT